MPATRHAAGPAGPVPDRPEAERRLRSDAETNRQHILRAAGRLMAERGLATPLEDIAAAAGVGIATLYRRFPTRGSLVEALFEERLAAYLQDLQRAVSMADGWRALVWYLRRSAARQIADRALTELLEHDPGPGAIHRLRQQVLPLADTLVQRAKATGRLRSDFTVSDLALVQHMLADIGAATSAASPTAWQRYLTIIVDGLVVARPRPTPPPDAALTIDQLEALRAARPSNCASLHGRPKH